MIAFLLLLAALAAQSLTHSVSGTVIDGGSHAPVFGAVIAAPNGKRLAITDRAGRFKVAAAVSAIEVSAPHLATRSIALPKADVDVDLGKVLLWRSGRLRVSMTPLLSDEHIRWALGRGEPGAKTLEEVRHGTVPEHQTQFSVDAIEPAHYILTFQGDGPLQHYAVPVAVEPGADLVVPVTIVPSFVDIQVSSGVKPTPDATVTFDHTTLLWNGKVTCDDLGKASVELWQSGKFWISTHIHGIFVDAELETLPAGKEHIPVEVRLPAHAIHGHVVDSASGAPIKDANIALEVAAKGVRTTQSNAAGDFEFEAVREGEQILRVYKKGYRFNRPYQVVIHEDDDVVDRSISLVPETAARSVHVLDHNGTPVAGASTFFGFGAAVQLLEATDQAGNVDVPEGAGVLFVVPPTGSFAFRAIAADETGSITMTVPPGKGLLSITSESTKQEAIPYVMFVLRVDGTLLPPSVLGRLASIQHLPFRTDADGRAQLSGLPFGRYDIWPVRSREDIQRVYSGAASAPAATVIVSSLPQNVTLTFEQVRK